MCTGFIYKGSDLLFGFNLDVDPKVWEIDIYKNNNYFALGAKVGSKIYYIHGVNAKTGFSNLPYCNDEGKYNIDKNKKKERIDLLTDKYIRGKYNYDDVIDILKNKEVVNIKNMSMHTLLADLKGHVVLFEPGLGYKLIKDKYAVVSNYPLLKEVKDDKKVYGKDRYKKVELALKKLKDLSIEKSFKILESAKQTGKWATRVSFVYSKNNNCVYYVLNNKFNKVYKHEFK